MRKLTPLITASVIAAMLSVNPTPSTANGAGGPTRATNATGSGNTNWSYDWRSQEWSKRPWEMRDYTVPATTLSGKRPPPDLTRLNTLPMPAQGIIGYNRATRQYFHVGRDGKVSPHADPQTRSGGCTSSCTKDY